MYRIPKVSRRLVRNISDSGPDDWISPLIVVSRGLVSVGSCAPFPYVGTALSAGLALLELIQTVGRTADELKYLAESVVAIMKLLHDEMECHNHSRRTDGYRFERVCVEFHAHLNQLLNDIQAMSADWSSSRLRKYLKVNCVREEVAQFTRRVTDLRANATLMAATGTRMDLADVASAIEDVRTNVSHIQREMKIMRSTTPQPVTTLQQEFVRYEEDYHALKLGDIELDFDTARTSDFDLPGDNEGTKLGWTDYKGRVKGSPRTIRVYRGSDPLQSWKSFLSVLAECSPSPNLPQLFGFCSSPKLPALVFHGEFQTLDEYGTSLQSPHAIVKWEQKLVEQVMELHRYRLFQSEWVVLYARRFALVNAQNGKLVMMHVEEGMNSDFPCLTPGVGNEPFIEWFMRFDLFDMAKYFPETPGRLEAGPSTQLTRFDAELSRLAMLVRTGQRYLFPPATALTSRGRVFPFQQGVPGVPVARLGKEDPMVDGEWEVVREYPGTLKADEFPSLENFAHVVRSQQREGWTHFCVPFQRNWMSLHDLTLRSGYFLSASLGVGENIPDPTLPWIAQAAIFGPKIDNHLCGIPVRTNLHLTWEMSLSDEDLSLDEYEPPEHIHVFVEIPTLAGGHTLEPRTYWSVSPDTTTKTKTIPRRSAFRLRRLWETRIQMVRWEKHHYDVAKSIQEEYGFDPSTDAAARALGLPLFVPFKVELGPDLPPAGYSWFNRPIDIDPWP